MRIVFTLDLLKTIFNVFVTEGKNGKIEIFKNRAIVRNADAGPVPFV